MFVFAGPTLSAEEGRAVLDATFLPPVTQGDVYAAVRERPWAIGIVDGYFERVPAVWHKEILWAMSRGVHVFGSASMGALRAAELHPFGMVGVGRIFEDFRTGVLEDDDEVTVVHAPSDAGYLAGSEAMVNIRATLDAADGVIADDTKRTLLSAAKARYYPERTWPRLLEDGREAGLPGDELDALAGWLPDGRRDRKKADALAMLAAMSDAWCADPSACQVNFAFEHTDAWEQVRRMIDRRPLSAQVGSDTCQPDAILDELRLLGAPFEEHRTLSLLRTLAIELARHEGLEVEPELLRNTVEIFRRERGLLQPEQIDAWLDRQRLNPDEFARLMGDEARVRYIRTLLDGDVDRHLPDLLRLTGQYAHFEERARRKEAALSARNLEIPSLADADLTEAGLWEWYFRNRLGRDVPGDVDAWARRFRFFSLDAFRQMVLREYCYLERTPEAE